MVVLEKGQRKKERRVRSRTGKREVEQGLQSPQGGIEV